MLDPFHDFPMDRANIRLAQTVEVDVGRAPFRSKKPLVRRIRIWAPHELELGHVVRRDHTCVVRMKLFRHLVIFEETVNGVYPVRHDQTGTINELGHEIPQRTIQ